MPYKYRSQGLLLQFSVQLQKQIGKMGIFSAFVFGLLIVCVLGEDSSVGDSDHDSLVPVTIFVTTEEYRACRDDGDCTFTPHSVSLNEPGDLPTKLQGKSDFEICRKIHVKLAKIESEHPEVKHLKLKLIQMLDTHFFELECEKGDLAAIKFLTFLTKLIEKMELEFKEVRKPEPIPYIEPITEEITAEPDYEPGRPIQVGSLKGIPGIHFPNYTEIPITSFTCSDKIIPGFYADLETGCQVFHLCYEHRRESFLCPIGTIFNQPILACDYWYSSNCSTATDYYKEPNILEPEIIPTIITKITEEKVVEEVLEKDIVSKDFFKFIPVKAKVTDISEFGKPIKTLKPKPSVILKDTEVIADKIFDGILSLGSKVISKTSDVLHKIPDPQSEVSMELKLKPLPLKYNLKAKALPLAKTKIVTSAVKLGAATKMASAAGFAAGKAKMAAAAAIPVVKTKMAAAAAIPVVKTKMAAAAAIPVVKTKMAAAAAIPVVKTKMAAAAAIPVVKTKMAAAAALPVVKTKMAAAAIPVVKTKMAAAYIPAVKAKVASAKIPLVKAKAASVKVPLVKGKIFALPLAKTKLGAAAFPAFKVKKVAKAVPWLKMAALKPKFAMAPLKLKSAIALPVLKAKFATAAVSPLTKKALAVGYLKLLKAKKLALMG